MIARALIAALLLAGVAHAGGAKSKKKPAPAPAPVEAPKPADAPVEPADPIAPAPAPAPAPTPSPDAELLAAPPPADAPEYPLAGEYGLYFRLGMLAITPLASSSEVSLENVSGPARLSVSDGPIKGSSVGMGSNVMPAAWIGWSLPILDRHLSIETVLAAPFTMKLYARGTLATQSLAPTAAGNLPTGVPALGQDLGEAKVLPPVLTATWRFGPLWRFRPYVGLGFSYLMTMEARITNPVLTEVATPKMEIPNAAGFVLQGGCDFHLWKWFFVNVDLKYIAGLDLTARVTGLYVRLPSLPLYEAVRVGDNVVHVSVNPLVFTLGVGMNF